MLKALTDSPISMFLVAPPLQDAVDASSQSSEPSSEPSSAAPVATGGRRESDGSATNSDAMARGTHTNRDCIAKIQSHLDSIIGESGVRIDYQWHGWWFTDAPPGSGYDLCDSLQRMWQPFLCEEYLETGRRLHIGWHCHQFDELRSVYYMFAKAGVDVTYMLTPALQSKPEVREWLHAACGGKEGQWTKQEDLLKLVPESDRPQVNVSTLGVARFLEVYDPQTSYDGIQDLNCDAVATCGSELISRGPFQFPGTPPIAQLTQTEAGVMEGYPGAQVDVDKSSLKASTEIRWGTSDGVIRGLEGHRGLDGGDSQVVLIVGYGKVGSSLAMALLQKSKGFKVLVYDQDPRKLDSLPSGVMAVGDIKGLIDDANFYKDIFEQTYDWMQKDGTTCKDEEIAGYFIKKLNPEIRVRLCRLTQHNLLHLKSLLGVKVESDLRKYVLAMKDKAMSRVLRGDRNQFLKKWLELVMGKLSPLTAVTATNTEFTMEALGFTDPEQFLRIGVKMANAGTKPGWFKDPKKMEEVLGKDKPINFDLEIPTLRGMFAPVLGLQSWTAMLLASNALRERAIIMTQAMIDQIGADPSLSVHNRQDLSGALTELLQQDVENLKGNFRQGGGAPYVLQIQILQAQRKIYGNGPGYDLYEKAYREQMRNPPLKYLAKAFNAACERETIRVSDCLCPSKIIELAQIGSTQQQLCP